MHRGVRQRARNRKDGHHAGMVRISREGVLLHIDISTRGLYKVIRIHDELAIIADISELKFLVNGYVKQGKLFIAVSFTNASYIYSGAVAVLLGIHKELVRDKGELCIIEPNKSLTRIFSTLHLDRVLKIYDSEESLPETIETAGERTL
jgi:anti-anti-sigma factor